MRGRGVSKGRSEGLIKNARRKEEARMAQRSMLTSCDRPPYRHDPRSQLPTVPGPACHPTLCQNAPPTQHAFPPAPPPFPAKQRARHSLA